MNKISWFFVVFFLTVTGANAAFYLQGEVRGVNGEPVADAEVFVYASENTRRPADYISAKTGKNGKYRMELPSGSFWTVARVRQDERFGPLALGYRHSGDPALVLIGDGPVTSVDFEVADLREQARKKVRSESELITVAGYVRDNTGKGAPLAYVYAFRKQFIKSPVPDYFSAWTGKDGSFSIELPPGEYELACSSLFPPPDQQANHKAIQLKSGEISVEKDLVLLLE